MDPTAEGSPGSPPVVGPHRSQRRVGVLSVAIGVAMCALAIAFWPSHRGGASAGGFSLSPVRSGGRVAALAPAPGHPVVLNFFASWCDSCGRELPRLAEFDRTEAGRVEVIGVDVKDNRQLASQMLSDAHAGFAAGYDPDTVVSERWRVDVLPVTVFIAPDGTVVDYHRGELTSVDLSRRAAALLCRSVGQPTADGFPGAPVGA